MSEHQDAGQSPPPERQDPRQQREPPASGHGVNPDTKNKEESASQIEVWLIRHFGLFLITSANNLE